MALPLRAFSASGYRSLRRVSYPMSRLDVFVGANGVGKSNLYRGLELVQAAAANTLGFELAREGLRAAQWAGGRKGSEQARITLGVEIAAEGLRDSRYVYAVELGYPTCTAGAFGEEPEVKGESLAFTSGARRVRLMDRNGPSVMVRNAEGRPGRLDLDLAPSETVLGRLEEPGLYPELDLVRRTLLACRFYHGLRTDPDSPLRRPCVAATAPTLASDGSNLAAVFATLAHIREDTADLDKAVAAAFPGATLVIPEPGRMASFGLKLPDFPRRVFEAAELSDGTLQFLALAGALLAYRAPPFIALNEPETSLHADLMEPLAGLIVRAARDSQVWVVTHSERLAEAVRRSGTGAVRTVLKTDGATGVEGLTLFGEFRQDEEAGSD